MMGRSLFGEPDLKKIDFSVRKTHSLEPRLSGVLGGLLSDVPELVNTDVDKG